MPDPTIHILSTRPLIPALPEEAAAHGIILDVLPFIATEPITEPILQARLRELMTQPLIAVFTSTNAVEAVARECTAKGRPIPWQIFCIGSATCRLVEGYFGKETITGTSSSAAGLAEVIIRQFPSEVFFFGGDRRREELPDRLQQASIRVNEITVYRTHLTPHPIAKEYNGIAFFSPSAVQSFFSINKVSAETTLFAIGETTAAAIRMQMPGSKVIVSTVPDTDVLIHQLIDYFQNTL